MNAYHILLQVNPSRDLVTYKETGKKYFCHYPVVPGGLSFTGVDYPAFFPDLRPARTCGGTHDSAGRFNLQLVIVALDAANLVIIREQRAFPVRAERCLLVALEHAILSHG